MIRRTCFYAALFVCGAVLLAGCTSTREAAMPPAPTILGAWDYIMEGTAQGTLTGQMVFTEGENGTYRAHITVNEMGIDDQIVMESVEYDGAAFTARGNVSGAAFVLTGTLDGDTMSGQNDVTGVGVFEIDATRVTEAM